MGTENETQKNNPRLRARAGGAAPTPAANPRPEEGYAQASAPASSSTAAAGANNPRLQGGGQRPDQAVRPIYIPANRGSMKPLNTQYSQKAYRSYAEQRRAQQPGSSFEHRIAHDSDTAAYYDAARYREKRARKPISKIAIVVGVLVAVAVGVGAWFYFNPAIFSVTVNGTERLVARGTTIDSLINEGVVTPAAGDLLAVDGTVIEKNNGYRFTGTVNGEKTTDGTQALRPDDDVLIEDGEDETETFTSTTTNADPERLVMGEGAIHAYVEGKPGVTVEKTGDISGIKTTEVQSAPTAGGVFYYNADTGDDKVIALTFDDGPWPTTTTQILDILKENGAKATFFTIGNQIADHTDAVKRAASEGHQICTHSWDHASGSGQGVNLTYMTAEEQTNEIQKGLDAIKAATGAEASTVFRTPGGNFYGDLIWTLQPLVSAEINWNIDTEDWRRPGAEVIKNRILAAQPGDIILMHDGGGDRSQTVQALREALPQLVAQGYRFVTIDELMALSPAANAAAALTGAPTS